MKRVLAFLLAMAPSVALANPLDTFGFGSRGAAMGGAVSTSSHDFSAGYYNPAGLVGTRKLDLSLGYFYASHNLSMNGAPATVDPVRGIVGGIVAPGTVFGIPFAFGIGLHLPDDRISRVRALPQEQPRWELYDNRNQRLYLAANVAIGLTKWLWVGGGISFMSDTHGYLDVTGSANIFAPLTSELRHEVNADLTAVRYPQLGARLALSDKVAMALVYRGEFALKLALDGTLYGDIAGLTTAYYQLSTRSVNAFLPQQVVLGTSWQLARSLLVAADLTWIDWSAYVAPVAKFDVVLDIPPPASGWPAGITPPTVPAPTPIVPLKLHDRMNPHIGIEWRAIDTEKIGGAIRAGYELGLSPIPPQYGVTNYIDRDRHSFSFGLGAKWKKPGTILTGDIRLDAHVQVTLLVDGLTTKVDPANLVGDIRGGGTIVNVGMTMGVGF